MRAKARRKPKIVSITPEPLLPAALESANIFRDKFGGRDDEEWCDVLVEALSSETIDDVRFPQYPPAELQNRVHGYSGQHALREAFDFYCFIKSHDYLRDKFNSDSYFLDFATGWGRMSRPFLRHFDLHKMFAYEPNRAFCVIARSLNPYICFINGEYFPDGALPQNRFDLVIGYSIFTHLSPHAATTWLSEMARITRPGGYCVFTAWGHRFLDRLVNEKEDLARGKEIHWYSRECLSAAGDIEDVRRRYHDGEFVWFGHSGRGDYGEAFLPPLALGALLADHEIPFDVVEFDQDNLAQDAFILRRRPSEAAVHLIHPAPVSIDQLTRNGWAAMDRRDWDDAITQWEALRAKAPDRAECYIAASHAYRELGRLDEAEALSREGVARFRDSPDALTAHAWIAMNRQDWDEALRRWKAARDLCPDRPDVYIWPVHALWRANRFDEADATAREALARYPDDVEALTQYAWVAMGRWDWDEALRRWQPVRERHPEREEAYSWSIRALRTMKRFDEAETMAAETLARFPSSTVGRVERIMIAADRGNLEAAAALLAGSRDQLLVDGRIHPELRWIDYRVRRMAAPGAAATETTEEPAATAMLVGSGGSDKELMLRFESVGRRCDLGWVQKHYDAEPLGLLRYAHAPCEALIAALDDRFAAFTEADDLIFQLDASGEHILTTRRYLITLHTYVYEKDLPTPEAHERFYRQHRERVAFLKDKLIGDLEDADKIFVYADFERLPDDDVTRLFSAIRRYGAGRLLCVRPAEDGHPDGTVEALSDGLYVGYIGRLADFHGGELPTWESWRTLCVRAYRLALAEGGAGPFCTSAAAARETDEFAAASVSPEAASSDDPNPLPYEESATFCTHPWSQLRIEGGGEAKVCCAYEGLPIATGGALMSVERHSLSEIWNSAEMRGLRRDLIAGRRVPGCRQCHTDEARGGISMRMRDNASWKNGWLNPGNATIPEIAAQAVANNFHVPVLPTLIEIEIGNLCNFKCRTCSGELSSLIAKDPVHEAWASGRGVHYHDPNGQAGPYRFRPAASIAKLGEELERDKDRQIRRLYFIGGEPLVIRQVGELLQQLVSTGRSQDIELQFITNGSIIPGWLPLVEKFRQVDLTVSIDGYGAHYEYIRYPGKWPELVDRLKVFHATPNLNLYVSSTIQMNNALNITQLFRYLDTQDIGFAAYFLHWPHYLAAGYLPPMLRRLAAERLRDYANSDCRPHQQALILSLASQFEAGSDEVDAKLLRDFMLFSNDLDATREQSIHAADPELVALLAQAGFPWIDERLHAAAD